MKLHEIESKKRENLTKRIGRGGKRGSYSGRGQKGQKSRAGRNIRAAERDLIQRLPKLRGFSNKPKAPKPKVFNIGDFFSEKKSEGPLVVDRNFLKERGFLTSRFAGEVKILGGGRVAGPLEVRGLMVSKSAREKIEKSGGKIEEMKNEN